MSNDFEIFKIRVENLLGRIAQAAVECGRNPKDVTLLPVTKNHSSSAVEFAHRWGFASVGENRVQEAIDKMAATSVAIRWELIGHLQSNKAKLAATRFDRVQSVDSIKLVNALNRYANEAGKRLPILLQINAGNDPAKFGADLGDSAQLLEHALKQTNLIVEGLMTIAPLSDNRDVARRTFDALRTLRDDLTSRYAVPLKELSMGMSHDITEAVHAGSTQLRIGTALFGERD